MHSKLEANEGNRISLMGKLFRIILKKHPFEVPESSIFQVVFQVHS